MQSKTVYVLTNRAFAHLVKIGYTTTDVKTRMRSLDGTGVPYPFECYYAGKTPEGIDVERAIHLALKDYRINKKREFFELEPAHAAKILSYLCIEDVTPDDGQEMSVDDGASIMQAEERRPTFSFDMLGIPPGTILTHSFDANQTCEVLEGSRVLFRGEKASLSGSALVVINETGRNWLAAQGAKYWCLNGESLHDLRLKNEAADQ